MFHLVSVLFSTFSVLGEYLSEWLHKIFTFLYIYWLGESSNILVKVCTFFSFSIVFLWLFYQDSYDNLILSQSLMPGTHLFCVYGDNWFQSVRYTLRCLVAVPQDTDCVETIKSTEEKLSVKKKELEKFQVRATLTIFNVCLMITSSVRVLRN